MLCKNENEEMKNPRKAEFQPEGYFFAFSPNNSDLTFLCITNRPKCYFFTSLNFIISMKNL